MNDETCYGGVVDLDWVFPHPNYKYLMFYISVMELYSLITNKIVLVFLALVVLCGVGCSPATAYTFSINGVAYGTGQTLYLQNNEVWYLSNPQNLTPIYAPAPGGAYANSKWASKGWAVGPGGNYCSVGAYGTEQTVCTTGASTDMGQQINAGTLPSGICYFRYPEGGYCIPVALAPPSPTCADTCYSTCGVSYSSCADGTIEQFIANLLTFASGGSCGILETWGYDVLHDEFPCTTPSSPTPIVPTPTPTPVPTPTLTPTPTPTGGITPTVVPPAPTSEPTPVLTYPIPGVVTAYSYTAVVSDATSGSPINGATLISGISSTGQWYTQASGTGIFTINGVGTSGTTTISAGDIISFNGMAVNYTGNTAVVTASSSNNGATVYISLEPYTAPIAGVIAQFYVIDASSSQAIADANATVNSQTKSTSTNGYANFTGLSVGTAYPYTVTKLGYYNSSGSFTPTANGTLTVNVALQSQSVVAFNRTLYSQGDTATISWFMPSASYMPSTYTYRLDLIDMNNTVLKTIPVTSISGDTTYKFTTSNWLGTYTAALVATQTSNGYTYWWASGTTTLNGYVTFQGWVNDAQTGHPIPGALVNISQPPSVYSQITPDGNYSTNAIFYSSATTYANVSATGYGTYTNTFLPYTQNIALNFTLIPTNPTVNGTGIWGVVTDSLYGRIIPVATVTISNTTHGELYTTISNSAGYYLLDHSSGITLTSGRLYDVVGSKTGYANSVVYQKVVV